MLNRSFRQSWLVRDTRCRRRDGTPVRQLARSLVVYAIRTMSRAISAALICSIQVYRYTVSPLSGPSCRFHPSCSAYAMEAIRHYGPLRGTSRTLRRLARCHPLSEAGYDPVR